jgi:hypothetical protein
MNVAYKHLDSKLRIAELSIGQWIGVLSGLAIAVAWGFYLSPFGATLTLVTSIYAVALPGAAVLFASLTEFDPWLLIRSVIAWRRLDGRFAAGPGGSAHGYSVLRDESGQEGEDARQGLEELDLSALWGRS